MIALYWKIDEKVHFMRYNDKFIIPFPHIIAVDDIEYIYSVVVIALYTKN